MSNASILPVNIPDVSAATQALTASSSLRVRRKWNALLAASLEVWCHQILYTRHVYPREVFATNQFLGVRCFVCRHPAVASYITNTITVAAPAIRDGVSNEIIFSITDAIDDQNTDTEATSSSDPTQKDDIFQGTDASETYTIKVTNHTGSNNFMIDEDNDNFLKVNKVIQNLERSMRDLILRVLRFDTKNARNVWSDNVSFRISLHIPTENKTCQELNYAFADGKWCEILQNTKGSISPCTSGEKRDRRIVIRPLHQAVTPMGVFHLIQRRVVASSKSKV
jgi:hypothetical protein